jgi:hypothetical protein
MIRYRTKTATFNATLRRRTQGAWAPAARQGSGGWRKLVCLVGRKNGPMNIAWPIYSTPAVLAIRPMLDIDPWHACSAE